jgi:ferrochelatase
VAAHYLELGGVSPINGQNRALLTALQTELPFPVYWGNRNWHPYLADTVRTMASDGVQRAAAFVTAAYSSYSSCRQYLDDLAKARAAVGTGAPKLVKLRPYFNHQGFVEPLAEGLRAARVHAGADAPVLMTAHSIPTAQAATCDYVRQLAETARLVAACAGEPPGHWSLVFQSRSGRPDQPWLGPDVNDVVAALPPAVDTVIVVPIGFVSDHMEVIYDLDRVAAAAAAARGIRLIRTATPGTHTQFVAMIGELVDEASGGPTAPAMGDLGAAAFPCPPRCCPGR